MALYIDADNISYNYISDIINNIKSFEHELIIKKIYCDWSKSESKNCSKIIHNYGLEPIQCFRIGKKQSTDIKLITDVITDMNIYKNINNVYIATSDVDFTYLCQTLKKMGKHITLFCLQDTILKNYVDNIINLKINKELKIDDISVIIKDEINEVTSLKKLKKKLNKKYNIEIDDENLIKCLDDNYHYLKKDNKIKYIVNLQKVKNNKNFKNSETYERLCNILSKKELDILLN
tara:strand:- start:3632 stop:4333 length:702 start_codon:yes stop_codon:yes gene_type:complete